MSGTSDVFFKAFRLFLKSGYFCRNCLFFQLQKNKIPHVSVGQ